ncbi:odorant receptor Or2-like [Anoplophora glabripennis]|uniref:odorant receptor Or2-like n=1 Tax=Anoplophora glabripennis TaxID=217634 RepID=UPI000874D81B|nr:odorant receptor Or2-like [Anoplophora glabripennis]
MLKNTSNAIKIQKFILTLTGLWPEEHPTLYGKISGRISVVTAIIFTATLIAEAIKQIGNYVVLIEHLSLIISPTSFLIKLIMFLRKTGQFVRLYRNLDMDIFNKHPDQFNTIKRKSETTSAVIGLSYMFSCFVITFFFCARPLYTSANMPVRFSFEMGQYKPIVAVFQIFCMFNAALSNSCLDVIAMTLMGIASVQIDILNRNITNFKKECDESATGTDGYIRYLNHCVKHHNEIIRYIGDIEEVFSLVFLAQYLTSGALICNIGFLLVHIRGLNLQFFNTVFYFAAMMCQLGMYCWFGNEIIVKVNICAIFLSSDTKTACYESDWIDCEVKVRKILIIIMERSKRPLFLTAGKFSVLSLNSFTTVMNSSYTYFALMQKLYSKTNN